MTSMVRVLLNPRSGSTGGQGDPAKYISRLFQEHGIGAEVTLLDKAAEATRLARQAINAGAKIVVAGGGDGTINGVASALVGEDVTLGVLPLGTLNHFARDLNIPISIEQAIAVIARGHTVAVDVGDLNGRIFLNNSGLGLYPSIVIDREQMKRAGLNKWISLSFAALRGFVRLPRLNITMVVGGREVHIDTPFVFVGNNRYEIHGARIGERKSLTGGELFLSIAPGIDRLGLLRVTFAAITSSLKSSDCFEERCVRDFTIQRRRRSSRVSLDGEVVRIVNPLHYSCRPGALRVCVPDAAEN
jgi:diacylglycerol kinase family enzyme